MADKFYTGLDFILGIVRLIIIFLSVYIILILLEMLLLRRWTLPLNGNIFRVNLGLLRFLVGLRGLVLRAHHLLFEKFFLTPQLLLPLLLLKLCLFFIFHAISVLPFLIVVGLTVLATIDAALLFVLEVLHELLQDLLGVHAHLLGEFKDLRVKLVVVDVVKVDLLVVLILDGLVLTVLTHQLLLLLLVVGEELLIHLQVILVHRLLAIVLAHVVVVVHVMIL